MEQEEKKLPYEEFIKGMMKRGYASSQTEVIRQALALYRKEMEKEVGKRPLGMEEHEPATPKKTKRMPLEKIQKEFNL